MSNTLLESAPTTKKAKGSELNLGDLALSFPNLNQVFNREVDNVENGILSLKEKLNENKKKFGHLKSLKMAAFKKIDRALKIALAQKEDALMIELPALTKEIEVLNNSHQVAKTALSSLEDVQIGRIERAVSKAESRNQEKSAFYKQVLNRYPKAQLINLSFLSSYLDQNKLPALALFDPNSGFSSYMLDITGIEYASNVDNPAVDRALNLETRHKLAKIIASATGTVPRRHRDISSQVAFQEELTTYVLKNNKRNTWANSIEIRAEFHGIIPKEARDTIKEAQKNNLFTAIMLVAEVRQWDVYYRDLYTQISPKLKGVTVASRPNPDPLIVGIKQLSSGQTICILIDSFDTTKLEQLVADEWCEKIDS